MTARAACISSLAAALAVCSTASASHEVPMPTDVTYGQGYLFPSGYHTYGGLTSQGLPARITADRAGRPRFVELHWRTRCGRRVVRAHSSMIVAPPQRIRGVVRQHRTLEGLVRTPPGAVGLIHRMFVEVSGRRTSRTGWFGKALLRGHLRREGRHHARCRPIALGWGVRLPRGRFVVANEVHRVPRHPVYAVGDRRVFYAQALSWQLRIYADPGRRLRQGRLATDDFDIALSGHGAGCDFASGALDFRKLRFDRFGQIAEVDLMLDYRCAPPEEYPTRARVVYRR